jgi:hypothetical protein
MNRPDQLAWLAKFAIAVVACLLVFAAITPIVASGPEIVPAESDGQAAPALIAYRNEPTPSAVLIGTSLTYRLKEQFFLPMQVKNLATPGRSDLNGLKIVASYPKIPASIFVEINVMTWNIDRDFVKKFSYTPHPRFRIAPPIRAFVSYLKTSSNVAAAPVDESILNREPAEYDNQIYVERAKPAYTGHNQDALILSNIDALGRIVQEIEARGSKVYFFELPMANGMADTDVVKTTSAAAHQRFPDPSRWPKLNYPIDQLRFADHAHLDERSALIVARAMRDAITSSVEPQASTPNRVGHWIGR